MSELPRQHYPDDVREQAVQEVLDGLQPGDVARRYTIKPATLYKWVWEARRARYTHGRGVEDLSGDHEVAELLTDDTIEQLVDQHHETILSQRAIIKDLHDKLARSEAKNRELQQALAARA